MSEKFLINWVKDTFGGFSETITEITNMLTKTPEQFNSTVWSVMMQIFNAILPIAYSMLALFFVIELLDKMSRVEMQLDLETVFKLVIRLLLAKMVMDNCFTWVHLIIKLNSSIVSASNVRVSSQITLDATQQIIKYIETSNMSFLDRLGFFMQYGIAGVIFTGIKIFVSVIVYGRFFQLFIMTALAPLPIATIGNEKTRHITMKFFQEYMAVWLQGLVILIAIQIYAAMISSMSIEGDGANIIWGTLKMALIIIVSIAGSSSLAKRITGVG